MIKRSFFALSQPRLTYDLLGPDPGEPETIPVPASLTLLLPEAIDSTQKTLIKKGDAVKKGEKLQLYDTSTAYTLSPAAGTIRRFDTYSDDFGNKATYIIIKPDPAKTAADHTVPFEPVEEMDFAEAWLDKLPGQPPFSMLKKRGKAVNTIVITGADPDILSTTCQYICTAYEDEIIAGAGILKRITQVPRLCMTLPRNMASRPSLDGIQILEIDPVYPSALPAMVMKDHLGMVLEPGKTPEDMGVCFIRAEALISLANVFSGKAQAFEKVVTLIDKAGSAHRFKATVGTPLSKVLTKFGIHINEQDRIIIGGPMKGFATFTPHHPVTPDMDMVIIQAKEIIPELSDTPCVNCGKCIRICPADIPVNLLVRFLENDQYEEAADKYDLEACIECGLCAYVCTARIPLYQYIRLGKHELAALRQDA